VTGLFRNNNPLSIILLFFYGIALRFAGFLYPEAPSRGGGDGYLYEQLLKLFSGATFSGPLFFSIISYLLVFIQSLMLNSIMNRDRMLARQNFIPSMSYLLVTAVFPEWWQFSSALVAITFILPIWANLISVFKSTRPKAVLFTTGILLGFASFLYVPSLWFIVLLIIGMLMVGPFRITDWIIGLMGVFIPYYFIYSWLYLTGQSASIRWWPRIGGFRLPGVPSDFFLWGGIGLLVLVMVAALSSINRQVFRMLIKTRKSWNLFFIMLLVALATPFSGAASDLGPWIICAPPLAAFHANVCSQTGKGFLVNVMHWGLVLFIIALNVWIIRGSSGL
jgi:hypothetical protein